MWLVKWIINTMQNNIREARRYAGKAAEWKGKNATMSDWAKDMAQKHLSFNDPGMTALREAMEEYKHEPGNAELYPGVHAMCEEIKRDMLHDTAEIKAMLEMLGR